MAIRYATKTGVWSDVTVWNGGASLPGVGDSVHANGFTVTIDQDINVATLSTAANGAPPAAGGSFVVSSITGTRSITTSTQLGAANHATTGPIGMVNISAPSGTCIINAPSVMGSTLGSQRYGIWVTGAASVVINADVYGSTALAFRSHGVMMEANLANVLISGKVVGGSENGGSAANGVQVYSGLSPVLTVMGDVYPNPANGNSGQYGVNFLASGSLDIQGTIYASTNCHAVNSVHLSNRVRTLVDAPNGRKAIYAPGWIMQSGQLCTETIMDDQIAAPFTPGSKVILSNYVSSSPPPSDVRAGVIYGPSNTLAGTLAMPVPDQVAYGVPVDASTGTATLKLAGAATAIGAQLAAAVNGG